MAMPRQTREQRREEIRTRLTNGQTVERIVADMSASKSVIYDEKRKLKRQQVVVHTGPDLMSYWVETVIYDQRQREVTRIACPLPSYKTGLEIALRSKGLKLP